MGAGPPVVSLKRNESLLVMALTVSKVAPLFVIVIVCTPLLPPDVVLGKAPEPLIVTAGAAHAVSVLAKSTNAAPRHQRTWAMSA